MRAFVIVTLALCCGSLVLAQSVSTAEKAQIAPTGTLRAALVKIPFLAKQDPASAALKGVAPDLADEMARVLGVPYQPMAYDNPNVGIAALREGKADVTFLAPTPERLGLIDFAPAFMQMEVTLIVPGSSTIQTLADADQPGRKLVVYERTANDEMVQKTVSKATIVRVPLFGWKKALEMISAGEADGFIDLRDQLMNYRAELPGWRVIAGRYGANDMAIGSAKERPAAAAFLRQFTETAIKSGFVTRAIERAAVRGALAPGS
jgi:polar amino acid transport system substrate-binding protein